MKFTVSSSQLLKQLQMAGGAIQSRPVIPILEGFLFKVAGNELVITASDLETSITTRLEVQAEGEGSVAIPARILTDTLKQLPEQPITFDIDEETYMVQLTSAYGKYKLAGAPGDDFPATPQPETEDEVRLPGAVVQQAVSKTIFAAADDELRPAMSGVFFQIDFDKFRTVATDAHKLVRYTYLAMGDNKVASQFIVPRKSLNLLKGILGEEEVAVAFDSKFVFFTSGDSRLSCRLIDAQYPDYNAVIPVDNPNHLTVSRQDLLSSMKRISIYANQTTNQVMFEINSSTLTITAQDLDFANEATEQLHCSYEGDTLAIAFNAKFLIEMLSALDSENVEFSLFSPTRAALIKPTEQAEDEDILMLLMPVMLTV
ncbi:MAG TPA: DNA polymerase III subunit beta [Phaeodactylibacter sp.]|nr:DNA polymerase III subunit beta [Phaeodactylibacter sp.]